MDNIGSATYGPLNSEESVIRPVCPCWNSVTKEDVYAYLDNLMERHLDYLDEAGMSAKIGEAELNGSGSSELIQGTLEMLILKTLALEPMHGYGVVLRIEQISGGVFHVNAGSLLPALSRMERAGRVKSEWRATENNRRAKYYLLTAKGRKALTSETEQWQRQITAIARILEA